MTSSTPPGASRTPRWPTPPATTPRGCCAQAWSIAEALRVLTAINASRQQATSEKAGQRCAESAA